MSDGFGCCESKVSKLYGLTIVRNQNIFRLEVPMIDANGMAEGDSIQNLQECSFGQKIITNESVLFGNIGEEVTIRTEFDHHESAIRAVQDFQ